MSQALSKLEETKRNECEREIRQAIMAGLSAAYQMGAALRKMRDDRLYRDTYSTFEDYCRDEWDLSDRHCHRLIDRADLVELARAEKLTQWVSLSERATRPIAALPDADRRRDAIREAVKLAAAEDKPLEPAHLRAAAKKFAPPKAPKPTVTVEVKPTAEPPQPETTTAGGGVDAAVTTPVPDVQALAAKFRELAAEARRFYEANENKCLGDAVAGPLLSRIIGIARNITAQLPA